MRLNRSSNNRARTLLSERTSINDFKHEYEHEHEHDINTCDEALGRYTIGDYSPFLWVFSLFGRLPVVFLSRSTLDLVTLNILYSSIKQTTTACILVYDLEIQDG